MSDEYERIGIVFIFACICLSSHHKLLHRPKKAGWNHEFGRLESIYRYWHIELFAVTTMAWHRKKDSHVRLCAISLAEIPQLPNVLGKTCASMIEMNLHGSEQRSV